MDFYFGIDLLQQLRQYYEGRLSLALAKGFDQQDAKYHWLFKELECRVSTLRKLMSMISVLPEFMCRQTEEQVFAMVVSSTSSWFSDDVLGEQPKDAAGNCSYYQESNPYWVDYQLAMDRFTCRRRRCVSTASPRWFGTICVQSYRTMHEINSENRRKSQSSSIVKSLHLKLLRLMMASGV